jgi:integrase
MPVAMAASGADDATPSRGHAARNGGHRRPEAAPLDQYVDAEPTGLVFTGPRGAPISRGNFRKLTGWKDALTSVGLAGVRFHDLRHSGNTMAARAGVSTKDLMARMGHDSTRAAVIYQHATTEADAAVAAALDAELSAAEADGDDSDDDDDDGTAGVLVPV